MSSSTSANVFEAFYLASILANIEKKWRTFFSSFWSTYFFLTIIVVTRAYLLVWLYTWLYLLSSSKN